MIQIDGAAGGGSILRISAALACGTNQSVVIDNIRKHRDKPGLRTQHLLGLEALAKLAGYQLSDAKVGSTRVEMNPGADPIGDVNISISTAASVSLIAQIITNYSAISGKKVKVTFQGGGTHTSWSPNFDYLSLVTIPSMMRFGVKISVNVDRYGFYPKGGARGQFEVDYQKPDSAVVIDDESYKQIEVVSKASNHLENLQVADRQFQSFQRSGIELDRHAIEYVDTISPGSSLTVALTGEGYYKGASMLGRKGLRSETIGESVFQETRKLASQPSSVDNYLADQLLVPLAASPKGSYFTFSEMTNHIKVNFDVITQILGQTIEIVKGDQLFVIKKL